MWKATARFTSPGAQVVVCLLGIVIVIIYMLLSVSSYSCLFSVLLRFFCHCFVQKVIRFD